MTLEFTENSRDVDNWNENFLQQHPVGPFWYASLEYSYSFYRAMISNTLLRYAEKLTISLS